MSKTYFLGIDTSTTSSKALLIDERGEVIAVASSPHTLQTPRPLWSEQNPAEWWSAVSASIQSVLGKAGIGGESIGAIGLTGQMHGLVLLNVTGSIVHLKENYQKASLRCEHGQRWAWLDSNQRLSGFNSSSAMICLELNIDSKSSGSRGKPC